MTTKLKIKKVYRRFLCFRWLIATLTLSHNNNLDLCVDTHGSLRTFSLKKLYRIDNNIFLPGFTVESYDSSFYNNIYCAWNRNVVLIVRAINDFRTDLIEEGLL